MFVAIAAAPAAAVEFNRDVRPILADHCFQCHGPDAKQRQGDLRLDQADVAPTDRPGGPVIVPGQPEQSELWRRVNSTDPDERMPPADKGQRLSDAQVKVLKQWISEGGAFERHWSLLPVRRPPLPEVAGTGHPPSRVRVPSRRAPARVGEVANDGTPRIAAAYGTRSVPTTYDAGPIDRFVLARLEKEGLAPSPPADRHTLLRRVSLALTGLPPTPHEIEAFLADRAPDAYDRVVDRLLASPRYGERMVVPWLDAARYADTSGYQSDGERHMWRWRDWVLEALNANMPFDQFTIEQLAGDLLPSPTLDQKIATGFNRNHRGNAEGGIIPEEYAVEYVADRVETTATVWLGLTLGCCRCHDHKYDPFSQRDFYSLFAFFNNVPEKGRAIKIGNSPPFIKAPTRLQEEQWQRLVVRCVEAGADVFPTGDRFSAQFSEWHKTARETASGDWYPSEGLAAHVSFDSQEQEGPPAAHMRVAGRLGEAASFAGRTPFDAGNHGDFGFFDKFTLSAWVQLAADGGGTVISRMTDVPQGDGYQLAIVGGKLQLNLVKRWLDDALRVETSSAVPTSGWHHVAATYDGSRVADGVKLYIDGEAQQVNVLLDELNQTFATKEPLRIGGGGGMEARFRGAIDEVRVYSRPLPARMVQILATPQSLEEIVALPLRALSAGQLSKLQEYYLWNHAPQELQAVFRKTEIASRELDEFEEKLPTVMVMQELPSPRPAHVLIRGQYDKPGERVEPNVPAELPPLAADVPRNRLGLAQWLVDPANPLTSRVTVNRIWQLHFGTGIVKTSEDFGRQGEWPSHPELLDWLAAEFLHSGWDVKRLHRRIVTSGTYRQGSAISDLGFGIWDLGARTSVSTNPKSQILNPKFTDPDNRLLSRGPRLRLSAEMVRDQALFASGLLVEQLGGPSVRPWQPAGLWSELTGGDDYQPGSGAELYRRGLYTFWKRTIPPPTLTTFDSPSREACIVRQSRTNTPLQALALLNEPTFVEAAKALAERVTKEADAAEKQITRAMQHVVGRPPSEAELAILVSAFQRYKNRGAVTDADALALVCSTILNLDEAVTSQ